MLFSVFLHALYLFIIELLRRGDLYRLLLACAEILCCHVHYAVGVDIESDLYLRDASRSWGKPYKLELSESLVVRGHRTFALHDMDRHSRLVIRSCREYLAFL